MRVLHTGTLDVNAGGPAMSTYYTLSGLRDLGIEAEILMFPLSLNGQLKGNGIPIHYAKKTIESKFLYSFTYKEKIRSLGEYDIYHAQGIWQYPTYALADIACKKEKPYLITPRGMLYPQDISKSNKCFKQISLKLRLLKDLNKASCVHVTCEDEMKHCRDLGVTSPIAVIPNPIEINENIEQKKDHIFRLGYLGRLSPRKNVEKLIYAWSQLKDRTANAELLIIGGGDGKYEQFLKEEVERLKCKNVRFTGFLSGKEKNEEIASISVLAMPSEFENFGNVILEGLIRKIPCIATTGAPWEELNRYRCGWWVDYDQNSINEAIVKAMDMPIDELNAMGERGYKLVLNNYSVESVSVKMKKLYEWILESGDKPDYVYE